MPSRSSNDHKIPADFPRAGDDPIANYLRWQECVFAAGAIATVCFDARANVAPGTNEEWLERGASLVCGENYTEEELRWVVRSSAAHLGL